MFGLSYRRWGDPGPGAIRRPRLRTLLRLEGFELEGQLVDLAGELELNIVAIVQHSDAGARVLADVESFVLRERDSLALPEHTFS